ncbi:MAG: hypothetical protein IOD10_13995 [Rhodocyclaceae bacterium]|nr:hypothetical protein [Rhodocyclaceae bacterium]MCA3128001.1 hypothetical protein [Rhodocyclaceae bacterium]MCA3138109.1 hypothetical protein [Rhodocyclaceae bacterium]MCA3857971.1 hypothetical protein [Burkholderia sp.]
MQDMPPMQHASGGVNPPKAQNTVADDATGSSLAVSDRRIHAATEVPTRVQQCCRGVSFDHMSIRNEDSGTHDEYRLDGGAEAELLPELDPVWREGGSDDAQTPHQARHALLSDPERVANASRQVSRSLVMNRCRRRPLSSARRSAQHGRVEPDWATAYEIRRDQCGAQAA